MEAAMALSLSFLLARQREYPMTLAIASSTARPTSTSHLNSRLNTARTPNRTHMGTTPTSADQKIIFSTERPPSPISNSHSVDPSAFTLCQYLHDRIKEKNRC